ncbi:hypothetical protein U1Q18_028556 [Sarracenia purpurea var. burkii]
MVRLGCDPRVCIFPGPRDLRASVPRPWGSPSTLSRRPHLWVRRASLVSPPTLDWGSAVVSSVVLLWFAADVELGFPSCLRAFATLGMV